MSSDEALIRAADELLILGLDDWTHIADIVHAAAPGTPRGQELEAVDSVVRLLTFVLDAEYVVAGDVDAVDGFTPWGLSREESIERIRKRWESLGRTLELGDICWLKNTDRGDERGVRALTER